MNQELKVSVVIATYNMPDWLEKVLWGYENQTYSKFEVIIADDGSKEDTQKLIKRFQENSNLDINHLWHEDEGYRRQTILNKAIMAAKYDYVLFTDGDCIPRADFIETHVRFAEKGRFLSGGYCKLPMNVSSLISCEDIKTQRCFDPNWLKERGLDGSSQLRKLGAKGKWADFLDYVTPANASFNNCNTSAWKADLIMVNGYDERMQYGGPDREIGERLENAGIRGKQIRHRAICVHLDHARGYKTRESLERNLKIRRETKKHKVIKTPYGIEKHT
ncbi:Putative two-domain glycosyltransferase [Fulvivirga imtechensis AK7]|uniref:Putative two-domain glycosyltransferase n=1 Tax=Fulvivirga imtechensis AK7 TaxID=1237149 RepID=L8JWQ0_9BACT|nr:glycosyltransferase family 2 protein [Fulvivirga imtechensis]ELR73486.1 Putative two-domain glycosyltransferase [Fulvivirga imtechensis AK7]